MKLRVAIIGAGPAGIYAADALLKLGQEFDVSVDLFERLPAPFGLVRYGVAPDHPRIKAIVDALQEILDSGKIRLFGNVNYGTDITLEDLKRYYHAVIFATGAMSDAELSIPGINLPGSFGAAEFVSWYDGHPDVPRDWPLTAREVAVIGNGNVALDVARMLVKRPEDLASTEIPDNVEKALMNSAVTDVHIFGRRGPMQVKFTPLELRELGELRDVDIVLDEEDFGNPSDEKETPTHKQLVVVNRIFQSWRERKRGNAPRRLHFHFWSSPLEIVGKDCVVGFRYMRGQPSEKHGIRDSAETREIAVQAVYRAVGYHGSPVASVPFDAETGTVPNDGGRVVDASGRVVRGLYVTGWIKRGPIGLIGHTKSDALETVQHLLEDSDSWWTPNVAVAAAVAVEQYLQEQRVDYTDLSGWRLLDAAEKSRGRLRGKTRMKVVPRDEMIELSCH